MLDNFYDQDLPWDGLWEFVLGEDRPERTKETLSSLDWILHDEILITFSSDEGDEERLIPIIPHDYKKKKARKKRKNADGCVGERSTTSTVETCSTDDSLSRSNSSHPKQPRRHTGKMRCYLTEKWRKIFGKGQSERKYASSTRKTISSQMKGLRIIEPKRESSPHSVVCVKRQLIQSRPRRKKKSDPPRTKQARSLQTVWASEFFSKDDSAEKGHKKPVDTIAFSNNKTKSENRKRLPSTLVSETTIKSKSESFAPRSKSCQRPEVLPSTSVEAGLEYSPALKPDYLGFRKGIKANNISSTQPSSTDAQKILLRKRGSLVSKSYTSIGRTSNWQQKPRGSSTRAGENCAPILLEPSQRGEGSFRLARTLSTKSSQSHTRTTSQWDCTKEALVTRRVRSSNDVATSCAPESDCSRSGVHKNCRVIW